MDRQSLNGKQTVRGFTLIELMVVLSIITLLLTVAVPIYDKQILKARADEAKRTSFDT